jgi:hypothetical protein
MNETIINYLMEGYDLHTNTLRTKTGLHHPDSQDMVEIILMKRLPGLQRKGGNAYAKGKVSWEVLRDEKAMKIVLADLQKKVDSNSVMRGGRV